MIKHTLAFCVVSIWATLVCVAQDATSSTRYEGLAPRRSEFITFSTRNLAEKDDRKAEKYYLNLMPHATTQRTYADEQGREWLERSFVVELPLSWRDRTVFLHTEGGGNERIVGVNGRRVGSTRDDRSPSEFIISSFLADGATTITIASPTEPDNRPAEMLAQNPNERLFLYAQPSVRIHDVIVRAEENETRTHGVLNIDVVITSSRQQPEALSVGYDIYSPEKELKYYDVRESTARGRGQLDTLHFQTAIYGATERMWSAENPKLYHLTLYIKQNRIITEYICLNVGFGQTSYADGQILRNGEPIELSSVRYNAEGSRQQAEADIKRLRREGINTIFTSHPQPYWFYDICNTVGMYVVEQANVNTSTASGDRTTKGTLANRPEWLDDFVERQKAAYYRSRQHPCVIAWSIGAESGGGYNTYKCYEWFKSVETERPVLCPDGEWNTDIKIEFPK